MPKAVLYAIRGLLALLALVAFAVLMGDAVQDVRDAADGTPPTPSDAFTYVVTALAALVGGHMAVTFGLPAPPAPNPPAPNPPAPNPPLSVTGVSLTNLAVALSAGTVAQVALGVVYLLVYILVGAVAVLVWVTNPDEVSVVVKNVATTFLALALPIAQGFFSSSD